jgi:hypothetical protein
MMGIEYIYFAKPIQLYTIIENEIRTPDNAEWPMAPLQY